MFDKILKFGTTFDWITPLAAAIRDKAEGDNVTIFVPEDCGWSGAAVARHLKRNNIRSWGHMCVNGFFMITIPREGLPWARYLLDQVEVPYEVGR